MRAARGTHGSVLPTMPVNLAGSIALVTMVYYAGIAPPLATAAGVAGRKAGLNFTQVSSPTSSNLRLLQSQLARFGSGATFSSATPYALAGHHPLDGGVPTHRALFKAVAVVDTREEGLQGGCVQCSCCLQAFLRGILANWLVNIAIWQATASSSIGGKVPTRPISLNIHRLTGTALHNARHAACYPRSECVSQGLLSSGLGCQTVHVAPANAFGMLPAAVAGPEHVGTPGG